MIFTSSQAAVAQFGPDGGSIINISSIVARIAPPGVVRLAIWAEVWQRPWMTSAPNPYRGFRYPAEVIQHAVWCITASA